MFWKNIGGLFGNPNKVSEKSLDQIKEQGDRNIKTLISRAEKNSDFMTLYNFLNDNKILPDLAVGYMVDSTGRFDYEDSSSSKDKGKITVAGDSTPYVSTLVHEMTHAVDRKLRELGNELHRKSLKGEALTPDEKQFSTNWQKSFGTRTVGEGGGEAVGMKSMMRAVADPKWISENSNYRTSRNEAIAHGVGNSQPEKDVNYFNLKTHMDPSIATEFMLLLDQARKIMDKRRTK